MGPLQFLQSLTTTTLYFSLLYTGSNANLIARQGPSPPTTLPNGWSYKGCYTDSVGQRSLQAATFASDSQSAEECIEFCTASGYTLAGTEYSRECFCGNAIASPGGPAPDGQGCSMACTGAPGEACGGPDRLSVYERSATPPAQSSAIVIDDGSEWVWAVRGCYSDLTYARILSQGVTVQGGGQNNSAQSCTAECQKQSFRYAGVEYGAECFCGNTIDNNHGPKDEGCTMRCTGNNRQFCGGPDRINLFEYVYRPRSTSSSSTPSATATPSTTPAPDSSSVSQSSSESHDSTSTSESHVTPTSSSSVETQSSTSSASDSHVTSSTSSDDHVSSTSSADTSASSSASTSSDDHASSASSDHPSSSATASDHSNSASVSTTSDAHSSTETSSDAHSSTSSDAHVSSSATVSSDAQSTTTSSESHVSSTPSPTSSDEHSSSASSDFSASTVSASEDLSGSVTSSTHTATVSTSSEVHSNTSTTESHSTFTSSDGATLTISSDVHSTTAGNFSSSASSEETASASITFANSTASEAHATSTATVSLNISSTATVSDLSTTSFSPNATTTADTFDSTALSTNSISLNATITASASDSTLSASSILSNATTTVSFADNSTISSETPTPTPEPKTGWHYEGCYVDGVGGRSLPQGGAVQGQMTNEKCQNACRAAGFVLAGTEYSAECYCGNTLINGGAPAPDGEAQCNMACSGNQTEICGGPNRLSLFRFYLGNEPPPSSTTASSSSVAPVPTGLPEGFEYKGCYVDGPGYRVMQNQQVPDDQRMTVASCTNKCAQLGYDVAGMEYHTQCFCDTQLRQGAYLASDDAQCNTPCGGDATQKCGGGDRLSVYSSQEVLKITKKPAPTEQVGNWTYQGCATSYGGDWNKPLPWKLVNSTGNSPEWCTSRCQKYGYLAAGMEYGEECYCGDIEHMQASGSEDVPESECTTPCPGDPEAMCGQGNRLTWYKYTGEEPLYVFNYPTGTDAGIYEFLVGSPVIPLIAQPLVNGKVSFLEKHGTGPNGTGAYELDPSLGNDIFRAFREMNGLRTDVFCAASLTMPDRAGRVINIGGWSGDSLFGVRLYWPDGAPGVNSTNDWQENFNEISLQTTRWYPTSLIMPNGSMLVVGGENGSNGPPVPNMEILPRVGGLKHAQWLLDTDPYNLYPFLAVLPSGGIFVQYYNEARILDERSLDTIKILPNTPATVNDDAGGRTYPFEGTMVLMPQVYPYSEPLEVLICGGSGRAPAWGIDNCITTQPDLPNPEWIIERMPSRRVLSCMTTLPDGTFLILNGAEEGVAGFGLADKSNFNAVLYDSRKPRHHRMSVMANTTIARMYHSEAVLMDDGRVLVSGSDPEDDKHPQEYRLEVFKPPYLLSGKPRPSFNIENKDWINGASYTFTVTGSANIKVSLLGSEASTHGNSMGSRILFPQVHCDAFPICTVVAPLGPYIAPPGWYRMFVLDDDIPSVATWVRIGGDPARLGDWPNVADFQPLPGVGPVRDLHTSPTTTKRTGGQNFRA